MTLTLAPTLTWTDTDNTNNRLPLIPNNKRHGQYKQQTPIDPQQQTVPISRLLFKQQQHIPFGRTRVHFAPQQAIRLHHLTLQFFTTDAITVRLGPVVGVAKLTEMVEKHLFKFCLIFSLLTRAIAWDSSVGCHFCGWVFSTGTRRVKFLFIFASSK